jgi:hypothetical protein
MDSFSVTRYNNLVTRPKKSRGRPRKPDALTAAERMRRYRARKREAGFRVVTTWVPAGRGGRSAPATPPRGGPGGHDGTRAPGKDYVAMAATGCSVSLRRRISRLTLSQVLTGARPPEPWSPHLRLFFTELPVEVVAGVARQLACPRGRLRRLYRASRVRSAAIEEYLGSGRARG